MVYSCPQISLPFDQALWITIFDYFFYPQPLSTSFSQTNRLWTTAVCMNMHFVDNHQERL